ncbi:hypothetical protein DFH08DRAFT_1039256 [Mycena albidolilacea]|uniref:Uncharacterized protein n=1 Tax=Mycena albidolilacea TaxID=1033008 RepID=A0AAD7EZL1_9AGAR|nr:hypothetical protein DFH08DRAFT_1039256 [Mycena albidolilacea]
MYNNRYHPYPRQRARQPPRDPVEDARLITAHQELKVMNIDEQKLCTYNHSTNSWVEIVRPQRVSSKKAIDIAASGLNKEWGKYTSPFFCPHLRRGGLRFDPLILTLNTRLDGQVLDFYRALDHECTFSIVVPKIKPRVTLLTLLTREEQLQFQAEQHYEDDEDDNDLDRSSTQASSSSTQASSSTQVLASSSQDFTTPSVFSPTAVSPVSSMSSILHPPSSPSIAKLALQAMKSPHTRFSGPKKMTPGRPTPLATRPWALRSYYSHDVAEARKTSDVFIMEFTHEHSAYDLFSNDPTCHLAWDPDQPPLPLQLYHKEIYTGCLEHTFRHLLFLYRSLGQVIRGMNSTLGVPFCDYASLVRYEQHRLEGRCTNHPDLSLIEPCDTFNGRIRGRSFMNGEQPQFRGETLDTPIGAALLEWNSRLGVPADVWMLVSTAVVHCAVCDLTRSFPAHRLHLDDDGACADPGQAMIAVNDD